MKSPYIFPKHIPGICHPNVNATASLIQDVEEDSYYEKRQGSTNGAETTEYKYSSPSTSSSYREIKRVGKHCEPFLHRSNLYKLQADKIQSDIEKYNDDSPYTKGKFAELNAFSKLFTLNYKYCIASQISPVRMNTLNQCYGRYSPQIVKAVCEVGRHDIICSKEKHAVERSAGKLVMQVARDLSREI